MTQVKMQHILRTREFRELVPYLNNAISKVSDESKYAWSFRVYLQVAESDEKEECSKFEANQALHQHLYKAQIFKSNCQLTQFSQ